MLGGQLVMHKLSHPQQKTIQPIDMLLLEWVYQGRLSSQKPVTVKK